MAVTSEPGGDVALVGAILPSLVPGAHKRLTAVRAGQMVFRSGLTAMVGIPPRRAAFVRTELPRLVFILNLNRTATLLTYRRGL